MNRWLLAALCVAVAPAALPSAARAQFGVFGQNKIHYRDFDWHVLKGDHVDVYYYPAEEKIARIALSYAEESYDFLKGELNHHVASRIPLILYASHSDFEQTNVLPFVPPEGILGATEYLKRRVTLPFRGSYAEFRHTLRHELVHVFQLSLLSQQFYLYPRARRAQVPLWWSEGMAEFLSSAQDSRDEMVVRELALSSRMPSIEQLNLMYSPIAYPVGGDLHHFLARRYGAWRIGLVYKTLWKYSSFNEALRGVYGKSVDRLSEEWHYELRQRYFPTVAGRQPITVAGRRIADLALKPVAVRVADSTVHVAYLSPSSGYMNIYRKPLDGSDKPRVVVPGERSPEFENFHAFSSRMDSRGGVLLFASKFGDRDALFFWDVERNKTLGRYQFDEIVSILSPAWSPDGQRVAFSGLSEDGVSDLYLFQMSTGQLSRLTTDHYEDLDPTWISDHAIVFSSDRAPGGDDGARNLYRIEDGGGAVTPLTSGAWLDESPRWDPERKRIYFSSDRDGAFNLYSVDTLGNGRRETTLDGGLFDPAPVPGDDRLVVSAFSGLTWSLFSLRPDSATADSTAFTLGPADSAGSWVWRELADARAARARSSRYRREFSLDFAAGVGAAAPSAGAGAQGAQFLISDLLGDHIIAVSLASYQSAGDAKDLLANINGNIFYLNQERRINWGVGAYRIAGTFLESDFQQLYRETSVGAYGAVRYPLSRFTRAEGQVTVEYSDRDDFANILVQGAQRRRGVLTGNYLSLVSDNSLWLNTGPIDGTRWNLTGGVVSDVSHGVFENWIGQADVRKYFRTSLQSAVAVRGFGYVSEGTRPRAVQVAGSWMLRGYPRYSIAGTRAWVTSAEWRFPIANFVALGFPFGTVRFPQVQGAFFGDLGQAWNRGFYDPRILGSAGVGFRMALLPGLVLRLDMGRRLSLRGDDTLLQDPDTYRQRFVDLFIGYNY